MERDRLGGRGIFRDASVAFLRASADVRLLASLLGLVVGYAAVAFAGDWAIDSFSANMRDRSLEAITTAVFVIGPAGAVVRAVAGFILSRAKKA